MEKITQVMGLFAVVGGALVNPATAQAETVGLTNRTPFLVRQVQDGATCANKVCQLTNQSQVGPFAGGTAFDGRLNAVWASNGTRLDVALVPDGSTRACRPVCRSQAVPQAPNGATRYTTGMCYLESGTLTAAGEPGPLGRLYFSYDTPVIGWCDARGCVLANHRFCRLPFLTGTARIGGLACDDIGRRLFIGTYDPAAAANGVVVYVTKADSPCDVICRFQVTLNRAVCRTVTPLRGVAGLAYDGCSGALYVTDGTQTVFGAVTITAAGACRWVHKGCCRVPVELYTGLAMVPPPVRSVGRSCTTARCNTCPSMGISLTGAAVLGNRDFRINLLNAPSNTSLAVLGLGIGPCVTPGINLGFCSNVSINRRAPGPLIFYFPTPSTLVGCNTNLRIPAPIPVDRALCNLRVSLQWVVGCRPTGTGVTGCTDVAISGI